MSNASTQASPHRPLLRRATWRHQQGTLLPPNAAIDAEEPRAQPALAVDNSMQLQAGNRHRPASTTAASVMYQMDESNNTAAVETVIRQSLLHHDLTLHSILAPDMTLSAIPSMSGSDRVWLRRETRQLIVRVAVYALISAMLISVADVMAQAWIIEEGVSFFDTSTFANFEDFFSFTGFTSSSASSTTAANGTTTVTTTTATTPLMTIIKYHVAVVIGTLVFSLVEVLFLYLDTLQFCFKMAQTCGIPLEAAQREHHQHSSHHAASVKALKKSSSRGDGRHVGTALRAPCQASLTPWQLVAGAHAQRAVRRRCSCKTSSTGAAEDLLPPP